MTWSAPMPRYFDIHGSGDRIAVLRVGISVGASGIRKIAEGEPETPED